MIRFKLRTDGKNFKMLMNDKSNFKTMKIFIRNTTLLLLLLILQVVSAQDTINLQQALEIALKNNFDIRIARHDLLITQKSNTIGNAGFLPVINAGLTQQNNINNSKQEFFSGEVRQGDNVKSNTLNTGIQLSWTVFDGMNMFVTKDKLSEFQSIGELNAQIKIENVIYRVVQLYHTIAFEQKKLEVIKQAVDISTERKSIAFQKQIVGSGSGLEVLQASVDLNADSAALLLQQHRLLDVMIAFNEILANKPDYTFSVSKSIHINENLVYDVLLDKLKSANPEIALAKSQASVALLDLKQQRSGLFPEVSVNSGYNFQKNESEIGIIRYGQTRGLYYGLIAGWTLFDGFNRQRQIQIARLNLANSELEREQTEMRLRNDLFRIYSAYSIRLNMLKNEIINLEAARENQNVAKEKMLLGSISSLELREAQRNLIEAEFRLILAEYEAKMAETQLLQLSGNLLN
jgi:outer membrane protein TolC